MNMEKKRTGSGSGTGRTRSPIGLINPIRKPGSFDSVKIHEQRKLGRTTEILIEGKPTIISYDDLEKKKLLGRGQYGIVNKVCHTPTGKILAAKRINLNSDIEDQKNNIMDLDVPLKTGDCPYTVKFYGALFAEGYIWILSECMDTSLDKFYLKAFSLNEKICEDFLSKVAFAVLSALDYLKKKNIMHRDIKPSNILINKKGEIKLCDFGISGVMSNSLCQTKEKGCRPYMAPEKIDPKAVDGYSVKSDIWSLGISLIEIATSKHPYAHAGDYFAQIKAIYGGEPPKLQSDQYSPEFCSFVASCLVKDKSERKGLEQLLEHDFIKKFQDNSVDLEFCARIIDSIQNDNSEN